MTLAVHSAARCGAVDYVGPIASQIGNDSAHREGSVLLHAGGVGVQVLQMRNMHGLTDLAVARLGRAAAPAFPLPLPVEVLPGAAPNSICMRNLGHTATCNGSDASHPSLFRCSTGEWFPSLLAVDLAGNTHHTPNVRRRRRRRAHATAERARPDPSLQR